MKKNPLVSIVVPCFNSINFIQESVESALNQSYSNFEVIVVDDGSTDGSNELLNVNYGNHEKVKIFTHEAHQNKGTPATRNLAIENSSGEYIAFLDSDDAFLPDKIQRQIDVFKKNEDVVLVHSAVNFTSEISLPDFLYDFNISKQDKHYRCDFMELLKKNNICNSTVMVPSKVFKSLNTIPNQLFQLEDWIQWLRISRLGNFFFIASPTCNYRYHSNSATSHMIQKKHLSLFAKLEMLVILKGCFKNKFELRIIEKEIFKLNNRICNTYIKDNNFSIAYYLKGFLWQLRASIKKAFFSFHFLF